MTDVVVLPKVQQKLIFKKKFFGKGMKPVGAEITREIMPKTASVSDDLDRDFVSWMEAKAGEDVVKTAAPLSAKIRAALTSGKSQDAVEGLMSSEKLKSMLAGTATGGALTAGAGALYLKGRKDQRAKTAGVIENQDNLDLLGLIRKRMAAGSALVGDV